MSYMNLPQVILVHRKWFWQVAPRLDQHFSVAFVCLSKSFIPLSSLIMTTFIIHAYYTFRFFIFYALWWLAIFQQLMSSVGLLCLYEYLMPLDGKYMASAH